MASQIDKYAADCKVAARLGRKYRDRLVSIFEPSSVAPAWQAVLRDGWRSANECILLAPDAVQLETLIAAAAPVPARWGW